MSCGWLQIYRKRRGKRINHLFTEFKKIKLKNFITSDFKLFVQRTNKDTYLKIFSDSLAESIIKPQNADILNSGFNFLLEHKNYSLDVGADVFEDLTKLQVIGISLYFHTTIIHRMISQQILVHIISPPKEIIF